MPLFSLEHSTSAYRADFGVYGISCLVLGAVLVIEGPPESRPELAAFALAGLAAWTLIEYALHRFVLHGARPFSTWHEEHHHRPTALIFTPTIVSGALIAGLVFTPAILILGPWPAGAFTLGVLSGYFAYSLTHHAIHHWRPDTAWTRNRKRWHALHHRSSEHPGYYGVTSDIWDRVFRSMDGSPGAVK